MSVVTAPEFVAPLLDDTRGISFTQATMVFTGTTSTGATIVATTQQTEHGPRHQSSWNDATWSATVGKALDTVVTELGSSIQRAEELAPSFENKE